MKQITTITELAKRVGRNKSSVSRWIGRDDWPFGRGPWKPAAVAKVKAWMTDCLQERFGADPEADAAEWRWMVRNYPDLYGPEAMRADAEIMREAMREVGDALKQIKHERRR